MGTQRPCRGHVIFVPGGEAGNDDTGIDCDQRRTRSRISREVIVLKGDSYRLRGKGEEVLTGSKRS